MDIPEKENTLLAVKKLGRPTKEMVAERERLKLERLRPVLTDEEVLADIKARFKMMESLTEAAGRGDIPAMVIPGAPGVGKSFTVVRALDKAKVKYVRVSGGISAIELYTLAYHHRARGNVILLDDCDIVFREEDTINVLKSLTDSSTVRTVSWRKQTASLKAEEIPDSYEFRGSIIFISNLDFQEIIDDGKSKYAAHLAALTSRSLYLDAAVHDRRSLDLWVQWIAIQGRMVECEGLSVEQGKEMLDWMSKQREKLREYSLRTLHKLCGLVKLGPEWKEAARLTLCR